ncbi:cytochrome c [Caulobacter sp.]|uniref:c-type cytochrome n=1 Tax=Caulobacter sp. TaxID=78 RepID=UPI002B47B12B|nr:cytochrome c [Caulobacter sp.]HJV41495.1 cytochrome c [Caulobacter sp.]
MEKAATFGVIAGIAMTTGALAHEAAKLPNTPAGKAIQARHDNFKAMGAANKSISDELKKDAPDHKLVSDNAIKLKALSTQVPSWFPKGSGPESKLPTDAKPEIWTETAKFSAAANRMQVEVSKLQLLAASGEVGALRNQSRAVGAACKSCHDSFRMPRS